MCLPSRHVTGHHLKQLRPCLYVVQNYQFQFEIVLWGKWTVIKMLFVYQSRREKINQLQASKIQRSFLQT